VTRLAIYSLRHLLPIYYPSILPKVVLRDQNSVVLHSAQEYGFYLVFKLDLQQGQRRLSEQTRCPDQCLAAKPGHPVEGGLGHARREPELAPRDPCEGLRANSVPFRCLFAKHFVCGSRTGGLRPTGSALAWDFAIVRSQLDRTHKRLLKCSPVSVIVVDAPMGHTRNTARGWPPRSRFPCPRACVSGAWHQPTGVCRPRPPQRRCPWGRQRTREFGRKACAQLEILNEPADKLCGPIQLSGAARLNRDTAEPAIFSQLQTP
jgi:hypothetical protein